ncbi:MAG TPA: response regulator [Acidimicrobiales bacterium]|nr:response regulator [Acidimicrobiales bacterium]
MQQTTEGAGQGRTVVVVEDNVRSRRLVRDLLELHGFGIIEAESAEEALEAMQDARPDLVLMDIQLPGMDGVAALRVLREDPRTADVPAIAVTAYAMRGDEERLLEAGFDAYIAKPIDTREFVPRLLAVLEARGG